jgi:hypothetical protein
MRVRASSRFKLPQPARNWLKILHAARLRGVIPLSPLISSLHQAERPTDHQQDDSVHGGDDEEEQDRDESFDRAGGIMEGVDPALVGNCCRGGPPEDEGLHSCR